MSVRVGVLNMDKAAQGETCWLLCCWDDCDRQGFELHKTRFHDHPPRTRCDDVNSKHPQYIFCSEAHRQLFINSHRSNGNRAPGTTARFL